MILIKTFGLFVLTAVAEIVGCYLPYLWLRKNGSSWLLLPACRLRQVLRCSPGSSRSTDASGRVYAAYGGVYVSVALLWLWRVDRVTVTGWDLAGVAIVLIRMGVVVWGGWRG